MSHNSSSIGFNLIQQLVLGPRQRLILRLGFLKCSKCKSRPIDILFDEYLGKQHKECIKCKSVVSILRFFIDFSLKVMHIPSESLHRALDIPYWRKGIVATIKGLAYFGANKPITTGAPLFVVWNFTNKCNLRCKHCYQNAGHSLSNELNTNEALGVVKDLSNSDVSSIAFSGGEPLLRLDFFKVANYAKDCGMYVAVATNGTLITSDIAKKLSKTVHYVEISLDGATPRVHDDFRGVSGSWERAITGIKYLINEGVTVGIATTATKNNVDEMHRIIDLAEQLDADYFICFNFIPTGRGQKIIHSDLSPLEREELLRSLYRRLILNMINKKKTQIYSTAPQFARVGLEMQRQIINELCLGLSGFQPIIPASHYANLPGLTPALAEFIGGCGAGRVYAAISPEGDVYPCVFMPIKLGSLRKHRFEHIWLYSPVLNELRDRNNLKGGCSICPYKYVCGGCRARAYGYFGDYLMHDPGCIRRIIADKFQQLQMIKS
ncbi:MAG: radical SAM protein [Nitrososphaerota archaeon]